MRELAKHFVWAAFVAGAFYLGAQGGLGLMVKEGDSLGRDDTKGGRVTALEKSTSQNGEIDPATKFDQFLRENDTRGLKGIPGEKELAELFGKASKNLDPLERRRSFDRILNAITPDDLSLSKFQ